MLSKREIEFKLREFDRIRQKIKGFNTESSLDYLAHIDRMEAAYRKELETTGRKEPIFETDWNYYEEESPYGMFNWLYNWNINNGIPLS